MDLYVSQPPLEDSLRALGKNEPETLIKVPQTSQVQTPGRMIDLRNGSQDARANWDRAANLALLSLGLLLKRFRGGRVYKGKNIFNAWAMGLTC